MAEPKMPIAVDLDGTLIFQDVTLLSVLMLLKQAPWKIFQVLRWLLKGRPYLKARAAMAVPFNPSALPYNTGLVEYLKQLKQEGHRLCLATAASHYHAQAVAAYLGIFDTVLSSDLRTNLRSAQKAAALNALYGAGSYVYAGNETADLKVWQQAGEIWIVNAKPRLIRQVCQWGKPFKIFS